MESEEEEIEDISMDDEDVGVDVEEFEAQGVDPITRLLEYVPLHKPKTKGVERHRQKQYPLANPFSAG